MELHNLKASIRDNGGKGSARRTRRAGDVPAVLYGGNGDPVLLAVNYRTFEHLLRGRLGEHAIVQLDVEGALESTPVMIRDVQHHSVRGNILHADFMRISLDEKIRTRVTLKTEGHAVGVVAGGLLDHQCRELEIECFAGDVPEYMTVDISALEIGQSLHVRDLTLPDNVTILTSLDRAVVAVHAPRVIEEAPVPGAEVAEGEEPEAEEAPTETPELAEEESKE